MKVENFDLFLKEFAQANDEQKHHLLHNNHCELFVDLYSRFSAEQLQEMIELMPISNNQDLVFVIRKEWNADKEKARAVLSALLLRCSSEAFKIQKVSQLCTLIFPSAFRYLIEITPRELLPDMFFFITPGRQENIHALQNVLNYQGSNALSRILDRILEKDEPKLGQELSLYIGTDQVYLKLIQTPGDHVVKIVDRMNKILDDQQKKQLILNSFSKLSFTVFLMMVESMSASARVKLVLSRMKNAEQAIFIEFLVTHLNDNTDQFMRFISTISDPEERYSIYTHPVPYRSEKTFTSHQALNTLMVGLGSVTGKFLGAEAKAVVDSLRSEHDVSEFLICSLLRRNSNLYKSISGMLCEMHPKQCTEILRKDTLTRLTLLFHTILEGSIHDVVELLASCSYHTTYEERLFSIDKLWLDNLKISVNEDQEGLVGFVALMNVYNYLAVRSMESGSKVYQESCDEFARMLVTLKNNQHSTNLVEALKQHCFYHATRVAHTIPLAAISIQLGTNRHYETRELLLSLNETELREGLNLFYQFIKARREIRMQFSLFIETLLVQMRGTLGRASDDLIELFEIDFRTDLLKIIEGRKKANESDHPKKRQVIEILDIVINRRLKYEEYSFSSDYDSRLEEILKDSPVTNRSSLSLV